MENLPAPIEAAAQLQNIEGDFNYILPTKTFGQIMGSFDKMTIEIVEINPDPNSGEVCEIPAGSGKKYLTKIALQKIGNAVGIVWDPRETGIIESTPKKARAKATGAIKKPNGEWIPLTEEKTVDIEAIEEEQRIKFEEKAMKGNPEGKVIKWGTTKSNKKYPEKFEKWDSVEEKQSWIDLQVRKAVLPYRKFKDERAMTGAKERVIRGLLAIASSYTDEQLSKPFAFPRIVPDVDKMLSIPDVRKAYIENMLPNAAKIFGNGYQQPDIKPEIKKIENKPETIIQDQESELTITAEEDEIDTAANAGFDSVESDPFVENTTEKEIDEIIAKEEKKKNQHLVYILRYLKVSIDTRKQALELMKGYYQLVEREKLIVTLKLYMLAEPIYNYVTTSKEKLPVFLNDRIKNSKEDQLRVFIKGCYDVMMREGE